MKNSLTVGILRERKGERRGPLSPQDVSWLVKRGVAVEVLGSTNRIFPNTAYKKAGASIAARFKQAKLLLGVKEPEAGSLIPDAIYCVFSHTIKGQPHNKKLLKQMLQKQITLLDYECLRDGNGNRLVYFGRFAGLCGVIDVLHLFGKRLQDLGASTPFLKVKRSFEYKSLDEAFASIRRVAQSLRKQKLPAPFSPLVIGITGHGHVSRGANEILAILGAKEIHPKDLDSLKKGKGISRIYRIILNREEKLRSKTGKNFYFEDYLKHPDQFESNLDQYLSTFHILLHGSYWDERFPRLVTKKMIAQLSQDEDFNLQIIGDFACDVKGAIEITQKTTTIQNPAFIYNPKTNKIKNGFRGDGAVVMAIDNLPTELPKDSSVGFSQMIRDYVYQMAVCGVTDLTRHHTLPREIREAVITQEGHLTKKYSYLKKSYKL